MVCELLLGRESGFLHDEKELVVESCLMIMELYPEIVNG